jgi:hypothetical protein
MSQPELVEQIRAARITASPELRARVLELATAVPPEPPRREWPRRRAALVLVPAAFALALTGALIAGLADSGKKSVSGEAVQTARAAKTAAPPLQQSGTARTLDKAAGSAGSVPATPGRAQLYESELTLKVTSLSNATKRALRLTRSYHGYVRSVDYGSGRDRGSAYMVLRVPIGSVQEAIVKFSALGEIVDQQVSIQDVQPTVDKRFRTMQAIRDRIAKLQAKLESPTLTAEQRAALEDELVAQRRRLVVLQKQQAALLRQTSFATVSLALRTADKAVVVPHDPGRIERALDRSGSILLDELKVVVYVLVVGAPLLALLALALVGSRMWRRRAEAHLLSR